MISSAAEGQGNHFHCTRRKYVVNICYHDVQERFVGHLNRALLNAGFKTTIDDSKNTRGEEISQTTLEEIEESRCSVLVFCEKFPFSTRCLDELDKILDCRELNKQLVKPVFYLIDPSVIRGIRKNYRKAMKVHRGKFKNENGLTKVHRWEFSLFRAANLSGWTFNSWDDESRFIQTIVQEICKSSSDADGQAGLKSHLAEPPKLGDPGSSYDVDTIGKNGIVKRGAEGITERQNFGLPPFFTCSSGVVQESPSTSKETGKRLDRMISDITRNDPPYVGIRKRRRGISYGAPLNVEVDAQQNQTWEDLLFQLLGRRASSASTVPDTESSVTRTSDETISVMRTLKPWVSNKFSELIDEGSKFKECIEYNERRLPANEKTSEAISSFLRKLLESFTKWSPAYENAKTELKTATADLSDVDALKKKTVDVVYQYEKAIRDGKEENLQLRRLEYEKTNLEEQLKDVYAEISRLKSSIETCAETKKRLDDEVKMLKVEEDEWKVRLPLIKSAIYSATITKENIEAAWLSRMEEFNEMLNSMIG